VRSVPLEFEHLVEAEAEALSDEPGDPVGEFRKAQELAAVASISPEKLQRETSGSDARFANRFQTAAKNNLWKRDTAAEVNLNPWAGSALAKRAGPRTRAGELGIVRSEIVTVDGERIRKGYNAGGELVDYRVLFAE